MNPDGSPCSIVPAAGSGGVNRRVPLLKTGTSLMRPIDHFLGSHAGMSRQTTPDCPTNLVSTAISMSPLVANESPHLTG